MCVQVEAGAVVADRIPADGRWGVFELLRDVFDQRLAVHALEGPTHLKKPNNVVLTFILPANTQSRDRKVTLLLKQIISHCCVRVASHQFRVHWVRSDHLTTDPHQGADAHGGQLTDPRITQRKGKMFKT